MAAAASSRPRALSAGAVAAVSKLLPPPWHVAPGDTGGLSSHQIFISWTCVETVDGFDQFRTIYVASPERSQVYTSKTKVEETLHLLKFEIDHRVRRMESYQSNVQWIPLIWTAAKLREKFTLRETRTSEKKTKGKGSRRREGSHRATPDGSLFYIPTTLTDFKEVMDGLTML